MTFVHSCAVNEISGATKANIITLVYQKLRLHMRSGDLGKGWLQFSSKPPFLALFSSFPLNPCFKFHSGNINSHFTFSPNAGSNVTRLLLATPFDYTGGLDKIWNYKLLVYITDDNLLSSRKKAEALVETGTVTLIISVIPYPTTIVTTTTRVRALGPGYPSYILCDLTLMEPFGPGEMWDGLKRVEILGYCEEWQSWLLD